MFFHEVWYIRALYSIPVVVVGAISCLLYYCFYIGFMQQVQPSTPIVSALIFLHFCIFCFAWAYIRAVNTDPGTIPANFDTIPTELLLTDKDNYDETDWDLAKITFCRKCKRNRPARAHHCSGCDRCILRMDHHCPWVGNCVGFKNVKFFTQFLVYSLISCVIMSCLSGDLLSRQYPDYEMSTLLSTVCCLSLSAALGGLAGVNVWMIICNRTALEVTKHPYNVFDVSTEENWTQICGSRWILWILPLRPDDAGDGVSYPVKLRGKTGESLIIYDRMVSAL